jgi:hypothetical protein
VHGDHGDRCDCSPAGGAGAPDTRSLQFVADVKGAALSQAVGASGAAGKLGDRTGTLTRTRPELESLLALVVDIGADDIGQKQTEVHCTRANRQSSERASARASAVLPTPGVILDTASPLPSNATSKCLSVSGRRTCAVR